MQNDTTLSTLDKLKGFLATAELPEDGRLPPERELAQSLEVGRSGLRKALATLQAEGVVWRHVGRGTFTGGPPPGGDVAPGVADIDEMVRRTNPLEVMGARIAFEPEVARCAAFNATAAQIAEMRAATDNARQAPSWRQYEHWDNRLHHIIGEAAQNSLLLGLLDTLNAVRWAVNWGRMRRNPTRPPADHHSFAEHERIVEAIAERDGAAAAEAMRRHLRSVERNMQDPS